MSKPAVFVLQLLGLFLLLFGFIQFMESNDGDMLALGIVIFIVSILGRIRRKKS